MSDSPCPFCGSKELLVSTGKHRYEGMQLVEVKTFCCLAQKKNADFLQKRYSPLDKNRPTLEELSKL